jgi:hypothetical protein
MKEIAFSMMCTPLLSFNSNRPLYITDSFVVSPVGSHEYCPAMAFNRHVLPHHGGPSTRYILDGFHTRFTSLRITSSITFQILVGIPFRRFALTTLESFYRIHLDCIGSMDFCVEGSTLTV